jgi:hypothetical protein
MKCAVQGAKAERKPDPDFGLLPVSRRLRANLAGPSACSDQGSFTFGKHDEYELVVATSIEERLQAWRLVYRCYRSQGYADPRDDGLWYGVHDALPETTTFLVRRQGTWIATATLVADSGLGLPADTVYGPEMKRLRERGRRPAEIVSLASLETNPRGSMMVLMELFRAAYLTARHILHATDLTVTVNPHHSAYYRKRLLFVQEGEERAYGKVGGAAAVLLRLDIAAVDETYLAKFGDIPRSSYRFFCTLPCLESR